MASIAFRFRVDLFSRHPGSRIQDAVDVRINDCCRRIFKRSSKELIYVISVMGYIWNQKCSLDTLKRYLPTTCWMITFIVRKGISPQGILLVARARHSFGGTDCRKCSMDGNNSTGSSACFSRSWGMFLASFQMHLRTSSATLNSLESVVVPLLGNGLTIWSRRLKSPLK